MSDQVFAQERPRLVGMAAKILGDAVEAEDIVQTAWLRLRSTQRPESSDPPPPAETGTLLCQAGVLRGVVFWVVTGPGSD
ncbi:hypothetical protein GCM10025883_41030 [Mobilicoccus caccae]|uniref:RNA polymerase sigma-70 region 2 domain-containing protein n=1 Tax=Mobilicoccus caccae TaxID=1859295 RepID=A0ABQ6IXL8_9MICO|nr:hypothetical protein GCM10025883_41030 [Mobilicoccus caccae]